MAFSTSLAGGGGPRERMGLGSPGQQDAVPLSAGHADEDPFLSHGGACETEASVTGRPQTPVALSPQTPADRMMKIEEGCTAR